MSKLPNLFVDDSDSDVDIKTDNEYAKKYDVWRKKEEFNKLKTKYGEEIDVDDDSSSSSDDDVEEIEFTEKAEKDFFKTLACLKNKDPRIYDDNVKFFDNEEQTVPRKKKEKKEGPMYLKDYERNIILEKGGMLSDEEDDTENRPKSPTYTEEQKNLKESLKSALSAINEEEDDEEWGGLFKERRKTKDEKEAEEVDYKKWLGGQASKLEDKEIEAELKPLKDYWNNPCLDKGEKFLVDYIVNKKFLDKADGDYIPTYEEVIHDSDQGLSDDEEAIEKQEEFEHKYNFRFEEPDQDFLKRYPRTMESSVRKQDDRRKVKRQEVKERKKKEKEQKMQDIKKLQEFKRKEIEEKLEKLREITGNADLGFAGEDIDGDFDPEAHDKRMQALFNDEFYQGPEEQQKPEFPDLDEELEIESWDRYEGENDQEKNAPHCEDDDFNMDCDYNPGAATQSALAESSRSKKKRKRKSKFAEAVSKAKPKFDPNDKNYEKYFEEYYKLDCEDIIGDIPCRFKYRQVVPNDFGLTTEEILLAKERELNRWCSLKKAIQIRPDNIEKYDQIAYKKKGQNVHLKRKIIPSLFTDDSEENNKSSSKTGSLEKEREAASKIKNDAVETSVKQNDFKGSSAKSSVRNGNAEDTLDGDKTKANKKNKKQKKKAKMENIEVVPSQAEIRDNLSVEADFVGITTDKESKDENKTIDENVAMNNSKKRKKKKPRSENNKINSDQIQGTKKRKRKQKEVQSDIPRKKVNRNRQKGDIKKELAISDARLAAYGINPKKFKNKLKYGKGSNMLEV